MVILHFLDVLLILKLRIHGIVVYSGPDTKFMMNSSKAPLKRSSMDIATNYQVRLIYSDYLF
jgi:hypothetical protein